MLRLIIAFMFALVLSGCGTYRVGGGATYATNLIQHPCAVDERYDSKGRTIYSARTCTEEYNLGNLRCTRTYTRIDRKDGYYDPGRFNQEQPYCTELPQPQVFVGQRVEKNSVPPPPKRTTGVPGAVCEKFAKGPGETLTRTCREPSIAGDGDLKCNKTWNEKWSTQGEMLELDYDTAKKVCVPVSGAQAEKEVSTEAPRPNYGRKTKP
jgi:hypothetical protein